MLPQNSLGRPAAIAMFLTEETFLSFSNAGRLKDQRVGLVVEQFKER
jgi:hypothetical protein